MDPVGIVGLFANLDAFKDLLLVGFQDRKVFWANCFDASILWLFAYA